MSSLAQLEDAVFMNLVGFTSDQDQITILSASMTNTDLTFSVPDATQISAGLIEVDDELMWCSSVDTDANTVTVQIRAMYDPAGPQVHALGAIVRNSPKYPRSMIKRAINFVIQQVYPEIFGVDQATLVSSPVTINYELPVDTESVIEVRYLNIGPSGMWVPVNHYKFSPYSSLGLKTIDIYEPVAPGARILVTYRKRPALLATPDDDFNNITGFPAEAEEVVAYGAAAYLSGNLETGRLSNRTAEAKLLDSVNNPGSASAAGKALYQMYQIAKAQVAQQLQLAYPVHINYSR